MAHPFSHISEREPEPFGLTWREMLFRLPGGGVTATSNRHGSPSLQIHICWSPMDGSVRSLLVNARAMRKCCVRLHSSSGGRQTVKYRITRCLAFLRN